MEERNEEKDDEHDERLTGTAMHGLRECLGFIFKGLMFSVR